MPYLLQIHTFCHLQASVFAGKTLAAGFTSVRDLGTSISDVLAQHSHHTTGSIDYIGVGLRKMIDEVRFCCTVVCTRVQILLSAHCREWFPVPTSSPPVKGSP